MFPDLKKAGFYRRNFLRGRLVLCQFRAPPIFFEGKALEMRLEFRVEVGDFWIGQFLVYL